METMDIGIRKFTPDDAEEFLIAVRESVAHVSPWLAWCTSEYAMQDAVDWVCTAEQVWQDGSDYRFVVEDKSTGDLLGSVGICPVVKELKCGSLGYWVRKSACNKGVCEIAARLAVVTAFKELDLQRIEVFVHPENHASNAVAAKLGGAFEGTQRNKIIFFGELIDANCYSIVPADYGL